jgi:hypothetical protein
MGTNYLDANNVIKRVYDPSTESLKTTSVATFAGGEVDLKISAADGDSILLSDGTNSVKVNPDGSIDVNVLTQSGTVLNLYQEVTNVPSGVGTSILSYTMLEDGKINQVIVAGTNIATYEVLVGSDVIDKAYTYFGGSMNHSFDMGKGISVLAGQTVTVRVTHNRPSVGDFNCRLQIEEKQ